MAKRSTKKEIVLEPKLDQDTIPEVTEEVKSEIVELDDSEELGSSEQELKGAFNNLEPMRKVEYKRPLRKLDQRKF